MPGLKVLISGAGIAGCSLAYWLARNGNDVTVVERGRALRSSGAPVDVRGPAADVAAKMNIIDQLQAARIRIGGMTFLDGASRRVARVDIEALRSSIVPKDVEIGRGELARILYDCCRGQANFIFKDSIKSLTQDASGVDVEFEQSPPRRFDLVVGADGLHSTVRRLAFGADSEFVRHAGLYAATVALPPDRTAGREMFMLNAPGKLAALHPCQGAPLAYFVFWHPEMPGFDYADPTQHKRTLEESYKGIGWRVPEFLEAVRRADDFYFDSVARVDVPDWSRGRIVLLGDASSCVSLFGDGSTLAIAGAYQLAQAIAESPGELGKAFAKYQAIHGKLVASKQKILTHTAARIVPRTELGIWLSTRLFWRTLSGVASAVRMGKRVMKSGSDNDQRPERRTT